MKTTFNPTQDHSCLQLGEYVHLSLEKGQVSELKRIFLNHPVLKNLESIANEPLVNFELWQQALSHSSFVHERSDVANGHYEKLEFLGDAILDTFVSEYLFDEKGSLSEGQLSKYRSALVNEKSLAHLARFFQFSQIILMGKGEIQRKAHETDSILCDVFESIIAALYKQFGFEKAKDIFFKMIKKFESETKTLFFDDDKLLIFDAKTRLQEKTMALYKNLPEYVAESCDDNKFLIKLFINKKYITESIASSKKKAENLVALKALKEELV